MSKSARPCGGALLVVRGIVVRGRRPVKVKGAYVTAALASRQTCGRQVGRVTSRSRRSVLGGSGTLRREHGAGLNTCVLDETLMAVIVDGYLVFVPALTCRRERGHRAFFGHDKTHATAFEATGEPA